MLTKKIIRRSGSGVVSGAESLHPVITRVLANRGVHSVDDLLFSNRDLLGPDAMGDIEKAARLIADHVVGGSHILVVGDYDADGATSSALGVLALRAMGAQRTDFLVPDRFQFGYGLSTPLVDLAATMSPDLLITVDNGISSISGARRARERGIDLVITDHHLPGDTLPEANAIVNPNLPGDSFPSKNLAGVGVVFYVLSVVRRVLDDSGWFQRNRISVPSMAEYLDLVALGTYADLVRLDANNRILVAQGLKRINAGRCRPGIKALVKVSGKRVGNLVASDLGFQIAPRLNAAGRLENMALGIECLIEQEEGRAMVLAERLDAINRDRKSLEQTMQQQALTAVDARASNGDLGLCVFHDEWHEGVVGLVASRLKERRGLPAIAFARGTGNELKGSARSVPGIHIRDVLCEIDASHPDLLLRFGGHAMAAGMSILHEDFAEFKRVFLEVIGRHAELVAASREVYTDGPLNEEFDDLAFIRELRGLAPWGQGFPEPVFDNRFRVLHQRLVGEVHLKMLLQPEHGGQPVEAIHFRYLEGPGAPCPEFERIHAAYRLDINEFAGRITPQLLVEYFAPLDHLRG